MVVKVKKIEIKYFRSIREASLNIGDNTALVGQNNSGKSTVFRALNCFFNFKEEKQNFVDGKHSFNNQAPRIMVTLSGLRKTSFLNWFNPGDDVIIRLSSFKQGVKWEYRHNNKFGKIQNIEDVFSDMNKQINFILIPNQRNHLVANGEDGLVRKLLKAWSSSQNFGNSQIREIAEKSNDFIDRINSNLKTHFDVFTPLEGDASMRLAFSEKISPEYLFAMMNIEISGPKGPYFLEEHGSGTQSLAIFTLYSILAKLNNQSYLLGFEEPEQNLHPQAQKQLIKFLKSLELQIIFTTHSSVMADSLSHHEIILCKNLPIRNSSFRKAETSIMQLPDDYFTKYKLVEHAYLKFHRRNNSEFLFSNFVIITESPNDAEVVDKILEKYNIDSFDSSISFISLSGKANLVYVYYLLRELGIPFVAIMDKDYFVEYAYDNGNNVVRDSNYFPTYNYSEVKKISVLEDLLNQHEKRELLNNFKNNHTHSLNMLESKNLVTLNYAFELDLLNVRAVQQDIFNELNLVGSDRSVQFVIEKRKNIIKKSETLIPIVENMSKSSFPRSYQRIAKIVKKHI